MGRTAFMLVVLVGGIAAQAPRQLGRIDFPTSGSAAAQSHFIQGVLLLHSFEYDDAREEFQAASKIEPGFAMAYWGEALTYTHPVWVEQDVKSARQALARLGPTAEARIAKAPTEREKDYLRAVEALYGEGTKVERDVAYAEAMGRMHEKYPDDMEAATLYAVALLGTCQHDRNYAVYMRAAAVAEEVFAKNPQHPGAAHYLIHAYDDPVHAPLGLRAARVYAKIAGSASHAQHMPSHIFIAMGMWDDVVASNVASVEVADARAARKGLGPDARNYHSLFWLEYAYLQEGRKADARRVLEDVARSAAQIGSPHSMSNLQTMRAFYELETGEADGLSGNVDAAKGGVTARTAMLMAHGALAVRQGRIEEARGLLTQLRAGLGAAGGGPEAHPAGMTMSPAGGMYPPKDAEIMGRELEAMVLRASGQRDEALRLLTAAAAEEDGLSFEFGPPMPVKPAHELLGEMLLADGRAKEARVEFERTLAKCPKRTLALRGLAKAAAQSGDAAAAARAQQDLKAFWHGEAL